MVFRRPVIIAVVLAIAVVTAGAAGTAYAAQSGDALTLSTDIAINSDSAISTWEQKGRVSVDISAPQMSITIGSEREHVGAGITLNPLKGDSRNDFIRITHSEDISRTVQIPISSAYWKPFPRDELDSLDENHTAQLEPLTDGGETYTLITVTFEGKDSAVFPVPEDAVAVYSASERTEEYTNQTFGIDLGLTPTPWSRIPDDVMGNRTAVRIEGNPEKIMIQYNSGTAEDPEWLTVPDERKTSKPVYRMTKDGVQDAVYVVSTTENPPQVRYKQRATWGDKVGVWVREARNLPDTIGRGLGFDLPGVDLPFLTAAPAGVA